jgi:hypothetical protein
MIFTDRISILEYCNREFPDGIGVEIGVAGGHFTKQIAATWKFKHLCCVDPWRYFPEGYDDSCNLSQQVQDERHEQFKKDFAADERVKIFRMMSHEASTWFDIEVMDFIYLDANHSFASVMQDLTCWWPILKHGGIFSGHDYAPGNGKGYGVKLAVDTFAAERGLTVFSTTQEYCRPSGVYGAGWEGCSFVIRKP